MGKPDRSPTTGKFIKRGLLAKLAGMFSRKDKSEQPLLLTHKVGEAEQNTTRTRK
jgi:hypothetical protein